MQPNGAQSMRGPMSTALSTSGAEQSSLFVSDLIQLTKPNITLMSTIVAGGSMGIAVSTGARVAWFDGILALMGIALSVVGASAFNMWLEKDTDGLMSRTKNRPFPAGRLQAGWGIFVGALASVGSLLLLSYFANALTTACMLLAMFSYVLVYTPMKRWSSWSVVIGSIPGAMPALMGYTALSGTLDWVGLTLFGIVFFWQIPHSLAITIYRQSEYTNAGFVVASTEYGHPMTKAGMLLFSLLTGAVAMMIWYLGVADGLYAVVAGLLSVWLFIECLRGLPTTTPAAKWARRVFLCTLVYQFLLFSALGIDVLLGQSSSFF